MTPVKPGDYVTIYSEMSFFSCASSASVSEFGALLENGFQNQTNLIYEIFMKILTRSS